MFVGIEIGGTKLQIGLGDGSGRLAGMWRGDVDRRAGADGIRRAIDVGLTHLLTTAGITWAQVEAIGVGFGGPVDDRTKRTVTSHQVAGWDNFPLADWLETEAGRPAFLGNDADVAALGEAIHGAGRARSPVFYMTIGTGIGGGLVIDGAMYRGTGRGAVEIGHVPVPGHRPDVEGKVLPLEEIASGLSIGSSATDYLRAHPEVRSSLSGEVTGADVLRAALAGDGFARDWLERSFMSIADGLNVAITMFCPAVIVLGGGVSLTPPELFLEPIRRRVAETGFAAFRSLTEIVTAELGEEVVVLGAIELAKRNARAG